MNSTTSRPATLFMGCEPNVLCDGLGWIVEVGHEARPAAPPGTRVVELEGRTLPGLGDAHIHLDELVLLRVGLDLRGTSSLPDVLDQVRVAARSISQEQWIVGGGWNYSAWPTPSLPSRQDLDEAGGGRPVLLSSKDEHSVWVSSSALRLAGIDRATLAPPDGVIDRDSNGEPTGILRESRQLFTGLIPRPDQGRYEELLALVLADLARVGLCSVHTMDPPATLFALQRLRQAHRLAQRVVVNLPQSRLRAAEELGIRSGWGDEQLRIWGVKAFLDGSLGSRTAEMLDGSGIARIRDPELEELIRHCQAAELNLCLHAIGDGAVHRAVVALERHRTAFPGWRPRIEHAQCVDPSDIPLFVTSRAVASMQPIHAVADREMAESVWGKKAGNAYAWSRLAEAGVPLAFGSDSPVESPDPLLGLRAATTWRSAVDWYAELALTEESALRAYTEGVAFACGMEAEWGRLESGYRCDLTVVSQERVVATVVNGRLVYRAPT
ncbi:MAG TPA: amidohydrolase [Candidatus Dormibacteraeota bacterium]|nr:amidohydrolase [Candidatus Dormibacteraeota bacterium]